MKENQYLLWAGLLSMCRLDLLCLKVRSMKYYFLSNGHHGIYIGKSFSLRDARNKTVFTKT